MTRVLEHRGPDDEGFHVAEYADGTGVGLGFRRLSIIDLDTGNQPIGNERLAPSNPERRDLQLPRAARDLVARGHSFATNADTEVIVHLYEDLGPRCVERLNGMFAFALWDEPERRLLLARDRFGKKPLYYADVGGTLLFGSELKRCSSIRSARASSTPPASPATSHSSTSLHHMRSSRASQAARGHYLVWQDGRCEVERYWDLSFGTLGRDRPDEEYVEEFRERFSAAVRRRLVSDVPLGAFLSGGIDSSSVVAMMVDALPVGNVKTFSIGFAEKELRRVAARSTRRAHFGTDHHEEVFTQEAMAEVLRPSPTTSTSRWVTPRSSRRICSPVSHDGVTVALGGDGSDELACRLSDVRSRPLREPLPGPRSLNERVVIPLADRLPVSTKNFSFDFKLKRFLRGAGSQRASATRHGSARSRLPSRRRCSARPADPYEEQRSFFATAPTTNRIERLIYLYAKTYLEDDVLVKVDRASMACSLEVRAPFLDVELVEFLGRVPSRLKLHRFGTKELLKRALKDVLPPGIAERPKKGFGIPVRVAQGIVERSVTG